MAFQDRKLLFAPANQAVAASTTSTDVIDLGVARDLQGGEPMIVLLVPEVVGTGATPSNSFTVEVWEHTAATSVTTSGTVAGSTGIRAGDTYLKGVPIPIFLYSTKRFLQLKYVEVGTATIDVHAFIAFAGQGQTNRNG